MKVVFFDRGDTLEHDDVLLPGALELLLAVRAMRDDASEPLALGLISNFGKADTAADVPILRAEYLAGLGPLGLLPFFAPVERCVTISSDALDPAFVKPEKAIFRAALDKFAAGLPFARALFVTEELSHVEAAIRHGMAAVQFRGPGQTTGVEHLTDLIPTIKKWAQAAVPGPLGGPS